jgi:CRISPR-associated protein Cas6
MSCDVCFPVRGEVLTAGCHYELYGALSRAVPAFHDPGEQVRFAPIGGENVGKGLIRLTKTSRLRVRLPADRIGLVLPLTGKTLSVGEHTIALGIPTVQPLEPTPMLLARLVTFKNAFEPSRFLEVARQRLRDRRIQAEAAIPLVEEGPHSGKARRRILRIKGTTIVGYSLLVQGLSAEESIGLQEQSVSGRTKLGCGFFLPYRPRAT